MTRAVAALAALSLAIEHAVDGAAIAALASFRETLRRVLGDPDEDAALTTAHVRVVRYCAEEVARQGDVPNAVASMVEAWRLAQSLRGRGVTLEVAIVERLGALVCPWMNSGGFRRVNVQVGDRICPRWETVPAAVADLVEKSPTMTPADAYREFELVHPFRDGNGRTGKVLFNWLNGTLDDPQLPPNFFGCVNL